MHAGLVSQIGTPDEIYENPASVRVADFIGQANFLDCLVARDGGAVRLRLGSGDETPMPAAAAQAAQAAQAARAAPADGEAILFVRPEHLHIQPAGAGPAALRGRVRTILYLGTQVRYFLQIPTQSSTREILVDEKRRVAGVQEGSEVSVAFDWESVRLFPRQQRGELAAD
jgi:iron(III) transport system ATP-binding protein